MSHISKCFNSYLKQNISLLYSYLGNDNKTHFYCTCTELYTNYKCFECRELRTHYLMGKYKRNLIYCQTFFFFFTFTVYINKTLTTDYPFSCFKRKHSGKNIDKSKHLSTLKSISHFPKPYYTQFIHHFVVCSAFILYPVFP